MSKTSITHRVCNKLKDMLHVHLVEGRFDSMGGDKMYGTLMISFGKAGNLNAKKPEMRSLRK